MGKASILVVIGILSLSAAPAFAAPAPPRSPSATPEKTVADDVYLEASERCTDGTIDILGAHAKTPAAAKFINIADQAAITQIEFYHACLTAIPGQDRACDRLASVPGAVERCREMTDFAELAFNVVNGTDAGVVCDKAFALRGQKKGKKSGAAIRLKKCRAFLAILKDDQSGDICKAISSKLNLEPKAMKTCQMSFAPLGGKPALCEKDPIEDRRPVCREKAALMSALRSHDPQGYARSPWCRSIISHVPEACTPYMINANRAFCGGIAPVTAQIKKIHDAREEQVRKEQATVRKPVYQPGAPMQLRSPEVEKIMRDVEHGKH